MQCPVVADHETAMGPRNRIGRALRRTSANMPCVESIVNNVPSLGRIRARTGYDKIFEELLRHRGTEVRFCMKQKVSATHGLRTSSGFCRSGRSDFRRTDKGAYHGLWRVRLSTPRGDKTITCQSALQSSDLPLPPARRSAYRLSPRHIFPPPPAAQPPIGIPDHTSAPC